MKNPFSKTADVFGSILAAGLKAILIATLIEIALIGIAFVIGILLWVANDFLSGLIAAIITFAVGQAAIIVVIDMLFLLPEKEDSDK